MLRRLQPAFFDLIGSFLLREGWRNLFIESGSSLVFMAEILEKRAATEDGLRISSNNALALLLFSLFTDLDSSRKPSGFPDPEDPYGAIFTRAALHAHEEPPRAPRPLFPAEHQAVRELENILKMDPGGDQRQLILATASGWDTTHENPGFRGPHVGSHPNMLFKRALFGLGQPVVLFLSRRKVDPKYPEALFKSRSDQGSNGSKEPIRYCYPVFGPDLPLERALTQVPVAICIGYETDQHDDFSQMANVRETIQETMAKVLEPLDFQLGYGRKEFFGGRTLSGALIFANQRFVALFPPNGVKEAQKTMAAAAGAPPLERFFK